MRLNTVKGRPRIWRIAPVGTLVALMCLAFSMHSEDAAGAAAGSPLRGPDIGVGSGGAQPVPHDIEGGASWHDGALETDELWRQRMNRIDRRARAELGLDD